MRNDFVPAITATDIERAILSEHVVANEVRISANAEARREGVDAVADCVLGTVTVRLVLRDGRVAIGRWNYPFENIDKAMCRRLARIKAFDHACDLLLAARSGSKCRQPGGVGA